MPLSKLNEEQRQAVNTDYGYNLVIASAGTGKTSTIVARIAHLLNKNIDPKEILLLTFTNKAAIEMTNRLAKFFDKDLAKSIQAGTFHSISYKYLKTLDDKLLLKQASELKVIFRSIHDKRNFSKIKESGHYSANYLYELYSFYKNTELSLNFGDWIEENYPEHSIYADIYEDIKNEFEELKEKFSFLDFNDLLIKAKENIKKLNFNFKEVLIDEYQDTNSLQNSLIEALSPKSLFCVGDYDQSIYAFNGANINIIASFSQKYKDSKVFTLKKNYRSGRYILSLANTVIKNNDRIYPKELIVQKDCDFKPKLLIYNELFTQYEKIAIKIQESLNNTNPEDIAIIFRNNSSADGLEAVLKALGINSKRRGGHSFFDSKEIKLILNIYNIFINPLDLTSFISVLEYAKGIGSSVAQDIYEALFILGEEDILKGLFKPNKDIKNPYKNKRQNSQLGLFDNFIELGSLSKFAGLNLDEKISSNPILKHPKLSKEGALFINYLYEVLKEIKNTKSPLNVLDKIQNSKLYEDIIKELSNKRALEKDGKINEELKKNALINIEKKIILLKKLAKPYKEARAFLNAMILGSNEMSEGKGVNLLTVHSSKGLEFKDVYVVDLMDGRFPNRKLSNKIGMIEEERRLFYVAVTRAKEKLFLSLAKYDKIKKINFMPSLFLYEAGLLEKDESYFKLNKD